MKCHLKSLLQKPSSKSKIICLGVSMLGMSAMFGLTACASQSAPNVVNVAKDNQTGVTVINAHAQNDIQEEVHDHDHSHEEIRMVGTQDDFKQWLSTHPQEQELVQEYRQFLLNHVGASHLPPLHELLTTARSWQECGHEPYQVPPKELWQKMLPTINLYNDLKQQGILPNNTQIRSVYRNPDLNRCAGGAVGSKHLTNGAMDIWVPTFAVGGQQLSSLQDRLCQYWLEQGKKHEFGLGLYATGAIHLDTQGYRKWGAQFSQSQSICRYVPPKTTPMTSDTSISITITPINTTNQGVGSGN